MDFHQESQLFWWPRNFTLVKDERFVYSEKIPGLQSLPSILAPSNYNYCYLDPGHSGNPYIFHIIRGPQAPSFLFYLFCIIKEESFRFFIKIMSPKTWIAHCTSPPKHGLSNCGFYLQPDHSHILLVLNKGLIRPTSMGRMEYDTNHGKTKHTHLKP